MLSDCGVLLELVREGSDTTCLDRKSPHGGSPGLSEVDQTNLIGSFWTCGLLGWGKGGAGGRGNL